MGFSAVSVFRGPGEITAMVVEVTQRIFTRPFQFREFIEQAWFITSVTLMPTIMVSIPFGAVISLQVGNLTGQLGAQSFAGATAVLATVREAAPIAAAKIIAGAAGSAICSDLGSRKIREEIDAMEVLGINPVQRLVTPRMLASGLVALLLNSLVCIIGIMGGYFFSVLVQDVNPGAFAAGITLLTGVPEVIISCVKATLFGLIAGLVACYRGLTITGGGAKAVGNAVNETVVFAFMALFVVNVVVTAIGIQMTSK